MALLSDFPEIPLDDFIRRFLARADKLMWFLGAGASAAAGIPTASDMIWEFKLLLYVTQTGASRKSVSDLSNPIVCDRLQAYIDSLKRFPAFGAPKEYADLFEAAYPSEGDRQTYLEAKVKAAKVSYGHMALATLMRAQLVRIVWMTNFDALVADACAKVYGATSHLSSVALDAADLAASQIANEQWPIEIKLHGDFRSSRLKNTPDELRQQDARLRKVLVESCRRFGLVAAGYSGRDSSIMDALEEALGDKNAFPKGLFWLHRGDAPPLENVCQLLARANDAGVEAALVRVENFDETLRDIIRATTDVDTKELDAFAAERRRWSPVPPVRGGRRFPVVRLNALPVTPPELCRRIVCEIGGHAEAAAAVERAGVNVLIARIKAGVLAYGSDADVRAAFDKHSVSEFDLHTIDPKRLRHESGERGLLRLALTTALVRARGVDAVRRRDTDLLSPTDPQNTKWSPLVQLVGPIHGVVPQHASLKWREGIGIRLDSADDRLWLLVEPRTVFEGITAENKSVAADFARERVVRRYNQQLNALIDFWVRLLAGDGGELRALGVTDGVDAKFCLSADTAFSWRAQA